MPPKQENYFPINRDHPSVKIPNSNILFYIEHLRSLHPSVYILLLIQQNRGGRKYGEIACCFICRPDGSCHIFSPRKFVCTSAEALITVIEPDNFAVGTNASNIVPGVTINRLSKNYGDILPTYSRSTSQEEDMLSRNANLWRFIEGMSAAYEWERMNSGLPPLRGI